VSLTISRYVKSSDHARRQRVTRTLSGN